MKSKAKSHLIAAAVTLVVAAVGFYFTLPAISIHNPTLLLDIVVLVAIYYVVFLIASKRGSGVIMPHEVKPMLKMLRIPVIVAACAAAIYIIGSLTGCCNF